LSVKRRDLSEDEREVDDRDEDAPTLRARVLRFTRLWTLDSRPADGTGKARSVDNRLRSARWGEALAAWFLRLKGFHVEARNWRCPQGELDLVCRDGDTLVFVEVKTRGSAAAGDPEDAVDRRKQQRLVRLAYAYLAHLGGETPPCRFDVVAIERSRLGPRIRHLKSAFRADP
jgi:putative endonuclease